MRKKYLARRFNYIRLQYSLGLYYKNIGYFGWINKKLFRKKPKMSMDFYKGKALFEVKHFRTTYEANYPFAAKFKLIKL